MYEVYVFVEVRHKVCIYGIYVRIYAYITVVSSYVNICANTSLSGALRT